MAHRCLLGPSPTFPQFLVHFFFIHYAQPSRSGFYNPRYAMDLAGICHWAYHPLRSAIVLSILHLTVAPILECGEVGSRK
jgi:hypothetical protein